MAQLSIWNSNQLRVPDDLTIDFTGDQLEVTGFSDPGDHVIRGIFAEGYSRKRPPDALFEP